tara:strand:+ start:727 stop:1356 length:630 start_codon:yes stop_codon:yes gene_type:complete
MARPRDLDTVEGRKRYEEKYQRILNAAMHVFAQKGFSESKITEVASAAGVGDGTIYLYFKNKDDLLISLFEAKLEEINAGLRIALADIPGVEDRLRKIIDFHLGLALNNPQLAALVTIELRRSAKFMKEYAKEQLTEYLDQWGDILEEGKRTGRFRPDFSTNILKHILFGAMDHVCGIWVSNPNRETVDLVEIGGQLTDVILRAISAES